MSRVFYSSVFLHLSISPSERLTRGVVLCQSLSTARLQRRVVQPPPYHADTAEKNACDCSSADGFCYELYRHDLPYSG